MMQKRGRSRPVFFGRESCACPGLQLALAACPCSGQPSRQPDKGSGRKAEAPAPLPPLPFGTSREQSTRPTNSTGAGAALLQCSWKASSSLHSPTQRKHAVLAKSVNSTFFLGPPALPLPGKVLPPSKN